MNYLLELVFCNHGACFVLLTWFNSLVYLQERIQLETARLYKLAGINPLAGTYVSQFVVALILVSYKVIEAFVDMLIWIHIFLTWPAPSCWKFCNFLC